MPAERRNRSRRCPSYPGSTSCLVPHKGPSNTGVKLQGSNMLAPASSASSPCWAAPAIRDSDPLRRRWRECTNRRDATSHTPPRPSTNPHRGHICRTRAAHATEGWPHAGHVPGRLSRVQRVCPKTLPANSWLAQSSRTGPSNTDDNLDTCTRAPYEEVIATGPATTCHRGLRHVATGAVEATPRCRVHADSTDAPHPRMPDLLPQVATYRRDAVASAARVRPTPGISCERPIRSTLVSFIPLFGGPAATPHICRRLQSGPSGGSSPGGHRLSEPSTTRLSAALPTIWTSHSAGRPVSVVHRSFSLGTSASSNSPRNQIRQ